MINIKYYNFDLTNKIEEIQTHAVNEKIDLEQVVRFGKDTYGIKRRWKILSSHNSVDFIKRLLSPKGNLMLTYYRDKEGEMSNYLIYIDFGKYNVSNNLIEFYDQELDIVIYNNLKYKILDMEETISAYERGEIALSDLNDILIDFENLVNNFNYSGIINSLSLRFGVTAINWLLKNEVSFI